MRFSKITTLLGVGGCLLLAGCGKNASEGAKNGEGGGGSGANTATGGAATGGAATSSGINVGNGGNGGATAGTPVSPTGQVAQDTTDGLATISTETADKLRDPAGTCGGWAEEPEATGQPPILEFVIDVTGSMADQPAYPGDVASLSKWAEMQRVLPGVFQSLPTDWAVGVSYFRKPDNGCYEPDQSVAIDLMSATQLTAIEASVERRKPQASTNDADNVQGATPTYAGWKNGLTELTAYQAPTGYENSERNIVLITDGVPTVNDDGCTYVNPITQAEYDSEIALVTSVGTTASVRTFVVGVLGSEITQGATYDPLYMLSQWAVAGQTAAAGCTPTSGTVGEGVDANDNPTTVLSTRGGYCHYDLSQSTNFGTDLVNALGKITTSLVSCTYALSTPPTGKTIDANKTVIIYDDGNGQNYAVLPNTSATCDKGWHFADSTNQVIEICSTTCDLLQANPKASINVVFGCGTGDVITSML